MLKELSENLNSIKKIQLEMKDTLIETKNNLQGNNSRVDEAKNQINNLKHKEAKNNHTERQEEKRIQKKVDSISSLWDNFKQSNIQTVMEATPRSLVKQLMIPMESSITEFHKKKQNP